METRPFARPGLAQLAVHTPRWGHPSRARLLLWGATLLVAGAVLLPPIYLLIRVLGAGMPAWSSLLRPRTLAVLGNTALLAIVVTAASALLSLILAWLTTRADLPGRRMWAVLTALPLVIPSYVGGYLMVASLGPRGMLQGWLEPLLGIDRLPEIYGFPGAALVLTLLSFPYSLLTLRAAFQRLDPAQEEAARSLGLSPWATFWRITLPRLQPALAAGSLLVALYTLRDFGAVSIMRYNTFTRVLYVQYRSSFDRAGAAGLALVLVALSLIVLATEMRSRQKGRLYTNQATAHRRPARVPLGRWKWPALGFCLLVVLLALIIPAGVLIYWLARGLQAGESLMPLFRATGNSLLASALAALVIILAALPVAVLAARRPSRLALAIERLTYLGFGLPGIAVALALVFFGSRYFPSLYQTLPLLLLAYLVLFLPQAVGAIKSSLLQIHPNLEEAARSLGRSPLQVIHQVLLPQIRPGLLAGAALVFLTTMKELPATLLLAPLEFKTLATSVWSAVEEAFFAQAAAPALLIILTSSLPLAYLVLREGEGTP